MELARREGYVRRPAERGRRPVRPSVQVTSASPAVVIALVVACIGALGFVAYWDERREATASLADLGREQAALARQLAAAIRAARSSPC